MFKKLFIVLFILFLSNAAIGEELRNQTHYKLYKEGKYQALGTAVSNVKVKDNDDIYYMGLAYYHLGRLPEAGKVWKEYVTVEKTKNKDKWIATFPPKSDDSWKDKITNEQRTDFRKSNYLIFENKYKDALNAYEATINKKINQSLSNQVELEAAKQKFVNKLERDRKMTLGGLLLILSILIGIIVAIIVTLIIRAKREKVRLAQQENDELNKNIELRSKDLELSDKELFNASVESTFIQRNPILNPNNSPQIKITPIPKETVKIHVNKPNHNSYADTGATVYHKPTGWAYPTNTAVTNIVIMNNESFHPVSDREETSRNYEQPSIVPDYRHKASESEEAKVNRYLEEERREITKLSEEKCSIEESKSVLGSNDDFKDDGYTSAPDSTSNFDDRGYSED